MDNKRNYWSRIARRYINRQKAAENTDEKEKSETVGDIADVGAANGTDGTVLNTADLKNTEIQPEAAEIMPTKDTDVISPAKETDGNILEGTLESTQDLSVSSKQETDETNGSESYASDNAVKEAGGKETDETGITQNEVLLDETAVDKRRKKAARGENEKEQPEEVIAPKEETLPDYTEGVNYNHDYFRFDKDIKDEKLKNRKTKQSGEKLLKERRLSGREDDVPFSWYTAKTAVKNSPMLKLINKVRADADIVGKKK